MNSIICPMCGKKNTYDVVICKHCKKPLGRKFDEDKADWTLFPFSAGECVVKILMFGKRKYARNNWQHVRPGERYLAAAIRHIGAWCEGETNDKESGMSHLWHAGCCLIFAIWLEKNGHIKAGQFI